MIFTFVVILLNNILPVISLTSCGLYLPDNFLTPKGLSTPFILKTISSDVDCTITNPESTVFVEAMIFDIETQKLSIYHPLIVNGFQQVEIKPEVPIFSNNSVVGLWFSSNSLSFSFINIYETCVDGLGPVDKFNYFSHCNADIFFSEIFKYNITIPKLEEECPSIRSFSFINEYQSYKTLSSYLLTNELKVAQNTQKNRDRLKNIITIVENTDDGNKLLVDYIHTALECNTFKVFDNTENILKSSLALNEIQTTIRTYDFAYISEMNPMVKYNKEKLKLYRLGLNQPIDYYKINPKKYCLMLAEETEMFLYKNYNIFSVYKTPDPYIASNLLSFMGLRFVNAWNNLNCFLYTQIESPITVNYNDNNIVVSVNINNNVTNETKNNSTDIFKLLFDNDGKEKNTNDNLIQLVLLCVLVVITIIFCIVTGCLLTKYNKKLSAINKTIVNFFSKKRRINISPVNEKDDSESTVVSDISIQIDYDKFYSDVIKLRENLENEKEENKKKIQERVEYRKKIREE
jgi:hypothetical protein